MAKSLFARSCGYHEHADIGAAKTIRDGVPPRQLRALNLVRGDSRVTWH